MKNYQFNKNNLQIKQVKIKLCKYLIKEKINIALKI